MRYAERNWKAQDVAQQIDSSGIDRVDQVRLTNSAWRAANRYQKQICRCAHVSYKRNCKRPHHRKYALSYKPLILISWGLVINQHALYPLHQPKLTTTKNPTLLPSEKFPPLIFTAHILHVGFKNENLTYCKIISSRVTYCNKISSSIITPADKRLNNYPYKL